MPQCGAGSLQVPLRAPSLIKLRPRVQLKILFLHTLHSISNELHAGCALKSPIWRASGKNQLIPPYRSAAAPMRRLCDSRPRMQRVINPKFSFLSILAFRIVLDHFCVAKQNEPANTSTRVPCMSQRWYSLFGRISCFIIQKQWCNMFLHNI